MPGQQHLGVEHRQRGQAAHAAVLVVVEQRGSSCGPLRGDTGCPVTSASPLTSTPSTTNEQCPPVWPGVGIAIGAPGSPAATSSVSACAVGMPSRVNAPLRLIATDHFSQRGCQMCVATSTGDACSRYSRLAWPTSSAWQYTGVPWVFANQMAEPKWSMWAWVNRIARRSSTPNPSWRSEAEHVVAAAGKAGVDQHDAVPSVTSVQLTRSVWAKCTVSVMARQSLLPSRECKQWSRNETWLN